MTVIRVSQQELNRLKVMVDLADGRKAIDAASALMGISRRQVYRLCVAFATSGPSGLISRRCGRPSNRKHGGSFRRTVLDLVRERYADFSPTLAAEKLAERRGLRLGAETLRQWMIEDSIEVVDESCPGHVSVALAEVVTVDIGLWHEEKPELLWWLSHGLNSLCLGARMIQVRGAELSRHAELLQFFHAPSNVLGCCGLGL